MPQKLPQISADRTLSLATGTCCSTRRALSLLRAGLNASSLTSSSTHAAAVIEVVDDEDADDTEEVNEGSCQETKQKTNKQGCKHQRQDRPTCHKGQTSSSSSRKQSHASSQSQVFAAGAEEEEEETEDEA